MYFTILGMSKSVAECSHWAQGLQKMLTQHYFNVSDVEITLYQRFLNPLCPMGLKQLWRSATFVKLQAFSLQHLKSDALPWVFFTICNGMHKPRLKIASPII